MNMRHFLRAAIAMFSLAGAVEVRAQCAADLTANGIVNGADLSTLLAYWGPRTQDPSSIASDLNDDAIVNGADLAMLLSKWGPCQSTITSITPNQGCIIGGTHITISGAYLGSTSSVTIGGAQAASFTVVNQSTIQAVTPASSAGPAGVRVTTAAGTITAPLQFTYMPASVSSITPNQGPTMGGSQITITGAYLALTTGVTVGGAPCTGVTVSGSNTVTAVTPPGTLGGADVVIYGGKGGIVVPGGYRYIPIVIPSWATLVEAQPDPDVVPDPALRSAIAATGLPWRVRDWGTGTEMMLMPPGTFQMGCVMGSDAYGCSFHDTRELPVHQVTLTNPFYMGRYEITQAQWLAKMGSNPSYFQATNGYPGSESRPVEQVSWNAIQGYLDATGLRLPTEAEWEFACRAGTQTPYYNGSTDDGTVGSLAWYGFCCGGTHPVGGKTGNGFGLHDMLGNVWEWVDDWYDTYPSTAQTNPTGPESGSYRVLRGGSWVTDSSYVRSSCRNVVSPSSTYGYDGGFRVARNP